MESTWILKDILARRFRSISWINKIELPEGEFDFSQRLDLFADDAWKIAKATAAGFPNKAARKAIPVCHASYHDGSEQDLYAHFATEGQKVLFIEISHSYIDHHFTNFRLWGTDQGGTHDYPVDLLFVEDLFKEQPSDRKKIGEVFIRPVAVTVHARGFDPSGELPDETERQRLSRAVEGFPAYQFWKHLESEGYMAAGKSLSKFLEHVTSNMGAPDGYTTFLRTVVAVCGYLANDLEPAATAFLSTGVEYEKLKFPRNADTCLFWALECGKKMTDANLAFRIAEEAVQSLGFLDEHLRKEVLGIIKSYYSSVFIGTAVLCRRLIEIVISEKLEKQFNVTIKEQIKLAKQKGEIAKGIGPGLHGILELAKLRHAISDNEYAIATRIKDFGNNIHEKGGIENSLDAKYAIQACLHLVHRV